MTPDSKAELTKNLCELAAMLAWVDPEDITPTTSLSQANVDSLGSIELIAQVEAHLGMMLPERDIPPLDTVSEIVQYAERVAKEFTESPSS